MGALHVRIDDRLIHGQIITAWAKTLKIEKIIAIDNNLANNKMLKDILLMGIPKDYQADIVNEQEALTSLNSDCNILLITRSARQLGNILDSIVHACEINIGNSAKQGDSIFMYKGIGVGQTLFFSQEDIVVLDQCQEKGLSIIFQQMPSDRCQTWPTLKSSLQKT